MSRESADFYFFNDLFNEKIRCVKMEFFLTKSQNLKKNTGVNPSFLESQVTISIS